MSKLKHIEPQLVWDYFEQICQVPRPSKKEAKIRQFLIDFATNHHFAVKTDKIGNVLISKPATPGKEKSPVVILQAHMDMVCEKNNDKVFNFETDSIVPIVENGWVKADGTTLGADNGIGIATMMAVLTDETVVHGPLECLITVDEETGLTGAFNLEPGFLTGKVLLNLDSEDEGELFIGCAGGLDTTGVLSIDTEKVPGKSFGLQIIVKGLRGGHSGDDINKERANAVKVLSRFLWKAARKFGVRIAAIQGGNLRNAIAREASALIAVPNVQKEQLIAELNQFAADVEFEYERTEPNLVIDQNSVAVPQKVFTLSSQQSLLNLLYACPHGVLAMSPRMPEMVETSTNLAAVNYSADSNTVEITTSQRSELESRKYYASEMVHAVFELAGAKVSHSDGYPGWTPNPNSPVVKTTADSYRRLFGKQPVIRSIHAGLECGLFLEKYPDLDMVSFGPTIRNPHSPDERIDIETVAKFWKHLCDVLKHI